MTLEGDVPHFHQRTIEMLTHTQSGSGAVRTGRCDGVDVEKMEVDGIGLEVKVNGTRRRSVYRQLGASAHMCACEPRIADKRETGWAGSASRSERSQT